jgi:hypothetical protein
MKKIVKNLKTSVFYSILFILIVPYEFLFAYTYDKLEKIGYTPANKFNNEPFFFDTVADLQEQAFSNYKSLPIYLIVLIVFVYPRPIQKNVHTEIDFSFNSYVVTNFFYFIALEILFFTSRFYCTFSQDEILASKCESTDLFIYIGYLLPIIYFIFFKKKHYIYNNDLINKIIHIFVFVFFIFNFKESSLRTYYPDISVYYQDIFSVEAFLIISILTFVFLFSPKQKQDSVIEFTSFGVVSFLLFDNKVILAICLLIFYFLLILDNKAYLNFFKYILFFSFLYNFTFNLYQLDFTMGQNQVLNEFIGINISSNPFTEFFVQYNLLLPLVLEPFLQQFKYLMLILNFLIVSLMAIQLRYIFPKYWFISVMSFVGFGIDYVNIDNFNFFKAVSSFTYNQTFPLRYIHISLISTIYLLYLSKKIKSPIWLLFVLIFSIYDNTFIGVSILLSIFLIEVFKIFSSNENYDYTIIENIKITFKETFTVRFVALIIILLIPLFIYRDNLFSFTDTAFRDAIALPMAISGFHIFLLISTTLIIIKMITVMYLETPYDDVSISIILYYACAVLFMYFYFLTRSHPLTLVSVILVYSFLVIAFLNYILEEVSYDINKIKNLVLVLPLILIFANGISNLSKFPSYETLVKNNLHLDYPENTTYYPLSEWLIPDGINSELQGEVLFLNQYGSIVALQNNLKGISPFINYQLTENQCLYLETLISENNIFHIIVSENNNLYSDCVKSLLERLLQSYKYESFRNEDFIVYSK